MPRHPYPPGHTLLLRVRGTVLPWVWRIMATTSTLALVMVYCYDPLRRAMKPQNQAANGMIDSTKKLLHYLFLDADYFLTFCTTFVTFILGFFNATAFSRWWKLRELCGTVMGRTIDTAVMVSSYVKKEETDLRKELLRYLALAQALHLQDARRRKDLDRLVQLGLLEAGSAELQSMQECRSGRPSLAYAWFMSR